MIKFKTFLRRLVAVIFGSTLLVLSGVTFLAAYGWLPISSGSLGSLGGLGLSFDPYTLAADHRLLWTGISAAGALCGVALIWLGVTFTRAQSRFVISEPRHGGGFGDVRVSMGSKGVRSLVAFIGESTDQVRQCDPTVSLHRKGWKVDCKVYVAHEAALPAVVDSLRSSLRQNLEHHTGLPVFKLDIQTELTPLSGVS